MQSKSYIIDGAYLKSNSDMHLICHHMYSSASASQELTTLVVKVIVQALGTFSLFWNILCDK